MSVKKIAVIGLVCGVTIGLVGCGGSNRSAKNSYSDSSEGIRTVNNFYGEDISPEEETALLNQKVVHFAYDNSELNQSDKRVLQVHAKYLNEHPDLQLRISGHTDERGSREYNVALGERRAQSVERFMQVKGVAGQRMVLVSYGKEQPVALEHDEAAWSQNRRAELDYEERG